MDSQSLPDPPQHLSIPSCDDLMKAIAEGQPVCDRWREKFAQWSVPHCVPHIVMNALDFLLIETILGPEESRRWLPLLREHYGRVKYSYPKEFAKVEQTWEEQRRWWFKHLDPPADPPADGDGRGVAGPPDTVHPAPAGPVRTSTHESHRPGTGAASAAPVSSASAAPVGGVAHAPTGAAPAPQLTPDSRDPDVPVAEPGKQPAPSPLPVAAAQPSPDVAPPPEVTASDVADEPPRLGASARAGPATAGARGRQLLEAAAVSHDAVRAVIAEWSREPRRVSEWRTWALSSTDVQDRARRR